MWFRAEAELWTQSERGVHSPTSPTPPFPGQEESRVLLPWRKTVWDHRAWTTQKALDLFVTITRELFTSHSFFPPHILISSSKTSERFHGLCTQTHFHTWNIFYGILPLSFMGFKTEITGITLSFIVFLGIACATLPRRHNVWEAIKTSLYSKVIKTSLYRYRDILMTLYTYIFYVLFPTYQTLTFPICP